MKTATLGHVDGSTGRSRARSKRGSTAVVAMRNLSLHPLTSCAAPCSARVVHWSWVIAVFVVGCALTGCGYSHGGTFPKDVASIAVPIFENRTPYRDVEFDLTEALVKEIELRTPYKVVRSGDADTILAGVVTDVDQRVLSRRAQGGLPQEIEVSVVVNFEWKHQRTGDSLRDRRGFETVGRHLPGRPIGEPFEVARHEAVQQLAKDIVAVMRADW